MAYLGNSPLNRLFGVQAVTLGQGQTAVNIGYTPGVTMFFKNGALLEPETDYTATDGSVVTLANPAIAGDVLISISLAQFAVANALPLSGGTLSGPLSGPASASESLAGLIKLATTAQAQALVDDETALTPKKLADAFEGSNQLLSSNGYQKLPGGLIIQWLTTGVSSSSGAANFTFPIAFPNTAYQLSITPGTTNQPLHANVETFDRFGGSFSIWNPSTRIASQASRIIAIGI